MSFHSWYTKSIKEAQDRYKQEDLVVNDNDGWDLIASRELKGGLVFESCQEGYGDKDGPIVSKSDIDDDLLRLDTDYDVDFKGVF